jgi:hypothetical protein
MSCDDHRASALARIAQASGAGPVELERLFVSAKKNVVWSAQSYAPSSAVKQLTHARRTRPDALWRKEPVAGGKYRIVGDYIPLHERDEKQKAQARDIMTNALDGTEDGMAAAARQALLFVRDSDPLFPLLNQVARGDLSREHSRNTLADVVASLGEADHDLRWNNDHELTDFPQLQSLPRLNGLAFRAPSGFPLHHASAADVIRFEREELGNDNGVNDEVIDELESFPAERLRWVAPQRSIAARYGDTVESFDVTGCPVVGGDGDGGFLVLLPESWRE